MAALVGYFFNETTLNKQARVLLFHKKKNEGLAFFIPEWSIYKEYVVSVRPGFCLEQARSHLDGAVWKMSQLHVEALTNL